ncbi:hypothetical protein LCGC14_1657760 [marine sediment metagenome]|uniref:Integrase catalytic domain-containing protein n=1 Tax=marine sediment metagenome TaxID=412755 RepID=A0A0F9KV68_9ZZZZ
MERHLLMSCKELARKSILELVLAGQITLVEASRRMGLSYRQALRVKERFERDGDSGLVHRGRGQPSNRGYPVSFRAKVLQRYRQRYKDHDIGPTLAAEKLAQDGLQVDHETLRRWLLEQGDWKKHRKRREHRAYRERKGHFGELVQMDGSHHHWFTREHDRACLMNMVDDATGTTAGLMAPQETTEAAMRLLWAWVTRHGIPKALYTDKKNVFVTDREPAREEQLAGKEPMTAFGTACEKLGIEIFEMKWGQGAKDIGGEVKLHSLERAMQLKDRDYIVLPDPRQPASQEAFKSGGITEFERHSRLGMVEEESFHKSVEHLRKIGAKYVTLKTGAYRPADLARAIKYSSDAKIDMLTIDGAGGGTGMSPWRMMNEWGIPTVQIESLMHQMCERLAAKGAYIPPIAIAGGLSLEDHVFKAMALGAPYVKAICLGRAVFSAAMVGKTHGNLMAKKMELEGEDIETGYLKLFAVGAELKERFGKDFSRLPAGAIGMYSYIDRMKQGMQQLMAGARKFGLEHITRNDIMALTKDAAEVSGIDYVMDADAKEVDKILG